MWVLEKNLHMVSENANIIKPHYHSEINTALGVSAQEERLKRYNTQKYRKLRCVHQLHQAVASTKDTLTKHCSLATTTKKEKQARTTNPPKKKQKKSQNTQLG
jgi:hypothetical protein